MLIKYVKSKLFVGLYINCSDRSSLFKNIQPKSYKGLQLSIYISYKDYINVIWKYWVNSQLLPIQTWEKSVLVKRNQERGLRKTVDRSWVKHIELFIAAHLSAFLVYFIQSEACYSITE